MPESLAYFRGQVVPISEAKVSILTHALHYGTTVFEGIRGNWNKEKKRTIIFRLKEHYDRLLRGCRILMIEIPYTSDELCEITTDLVQRCGYIEDIYIRPIAYKSEEKVANLKLHELASDFSVMVVPLGSYIESEGAIKCITSSWRRPDDTMMPTGVKLSGLYTTSILAKTEAVMAGYDEAILLNHDGSVSEGSGENLFLVQNGYISTPSQTDNCLLGITRDSVIKLSQEEFGIDVVERKIHRSELYLSDEIFLTGTAAHVHSVGSIDDRPVGSGDIGPISKSITDLYTSVITGNDPRYEDWCTEVQAIK